MPGHQGVAAVGRQSGCCRLAASGAAGGEEGAWPLAPARLSIALGPPRRAGVPRLNRSYLMTGTTRLVAPARDGALPARVRAQRAALATTA